MKEAGRTLYKPTPLILAKHAHTIQTFQARTPQSIWDRIKVVISKERPNLYTSFVSPSLRTDPHSSIIAHIFIVRSIPTTEPKSASQGGPFLQLVLMYLTNTSPFTSLNS